MKCAKSPQPTLRAPGGPHNPNRSATAGRNAVPQRQPQVDRDKLRDSVHACSTLPGLKPVAIPLADLQLHHAVLRSFVWVAPNRFSTAISLQLIGAGCR